jgi:hypothetical protein
VKRNQVNGELNENVGVGKSSGEGLEHLNLMGAGQQYSVPFDRRAMPFSKFQAPNA